MNVSSIYIPVQETSQCVPCVVLWLLSQPPSDEQSIMTSIMAAMKTDPWMDQRGKGHSSKHIKVAAVLSL